MKATTSLHDRGQSLWLDNITRDLLETGTLTRYIDELSVTGLTSNPTIFDHAIKNSSPTTPPSAKKVKEGKSGEDLFFELALEDLTARRRLCFARSGIGRAASTAGCRSKCRRCSPTTPPAPLAAAKTLHARAGRPNLLIKIPGTKEGLPAIEEAIFAGSPDQRDAALLARALPGGGRGVPARHRAPRSPPG